MVVVDASGAADVIETVGSVSLAGFAFDGFGGGGAVLAFLRAGADFAIDSHTQISLIFSRGRSIRDSRPRHVLLCRVKKISAYERTDLPSWTWI